MIALLLLLACSANALEVKAPSPNSGTITPSAITTGVGSFSGSVTASSVTSQNGFVVNAGNTLLGATGTAAETLDVRGNIVIPSGSAFRFGSDAAQMYATGSGVVAFNPNTFSFSHASVKVGIGETAAFGTSPTLSVNGNAQFGSGATKSTFTATGVLTTVQSGLTVGNSAATTANISTLMNGLGAASNNVISFIRSGSAERVLAQTNANDLVFGWDPASYTTANLNTSAKMIIKNDGSVGIGTASPATTLDVNGNAQFGSGATKSTFTATGFWEPISKTKAQIDALVPTKVGQVIYASDTTLPGLCISTGTLAAQWRKMESATLGCGTNN